MQFKMSKLLLNSSYFIIFLSGFIFFSESNSLTMPLMIIGMLFYILISINHLVKVKQYYIFLLIEFILLAISLLIGIIDNSIELAVKGISLFIIFLILVNYTAHIKYSSIEITRAIIKNINILTVLFLLTCIVFNPPTSLSDIIYGYSGILGNPNGLGMCVVPMTVIAGCQFIKSYYEPKIYSSRLRYITLFSVGLIFTILSASRTSLLSVILTILIVLIIEIFRDNNKSRFVKSFGILLTLFLLSIIIINSAIFKSIVLAKIQAKSADNDVLSDRNELWNVAIANMKFFGKNTAFSQYTDYSVHNTFLGFAINYGYIFMCLFIIFFLLALYKSFKYLKRNHIHGFVPFALIFSTILLYMPEQIFTSFNTFSALIALGVTLKFQDNEGKL